MFGDAFSSFFGKGTDLTSSLIGDNKMWMRRQDESMFKTFKKHEDNLLLNPGNEVGIPKYVGSPDLKKKTEKLAEFFNARKTSALQQMTMPGINQTRNM